MTEYEVLVGGEPVAPGRGLAARAERPRRAGSAASSTATTSMPVLVEGAGQRVGRHAPRAPRAGHGAHAGGSGVLAEAETAAGAHAGPIEVKATLPGLVVAVGVGRRATRWTRARRC